MAARNVAEMAGSAEAMAASQRDRAGDGCCGVICDPHEALNKVRLLVSCSIKSGQHVRLNYRRSLVAWDCQQPAQGPSHRNRRRRPWKFPVASS
jgi:hypothetical protein